MYNNSYNSNDKINIMILKGLGNIVQIGKSGAEVVTTMLDVQLKGTKTFILCYFYCKV